MQTERVSGVATGVRWQRTWKASPSSGLGEIFRGRERVLWSVRSLVARRKLGGTGSGRGYNGDVKEKRSREKFVLRR